jgi:hypothetical protein
MTAPAPVVRGRDLRTPEERWAHREAMRTLSPDERRAYLQQQHELMQQRAQQQGAVLPESLPGAGGPYQGYGPRYRYPNYWGGGYQELRGPRYWSERGPYGGAYGYRGYGPGYGGYGPGYGPDYGSPAAADYWGPRP